MSNHTEQKKARPESAERLPCLTADYGRLHGLQRSLLRLTGEKREKLQAEFAALLSKSRTAVAERRSKLPQTGIPA